METVNRKEEEDILLKFVEDKQWEILKKYKP